MNKIFTSSINMLFYFCLGCVFSAQASSQNQVVLASDPWCPKVCFDSSENPGYVVEAASFALSRHGYELKALELPWSRAIRSVENGTIDGLLTDPTGNTENIILPEHAYFYATAGYAIHNRVQHPQVLSVRDLNKIRFKLIQDYDYSLLPIYDDIIRNQGKAVYIKGNDSLHRILKLIVSNRADATIDDIEVLNYNIHKMSFSSVFHTLPISDPVRVYISISRKHPDAEKIARILSNEIHAMKLNGQMDSIMRKYLITPEEDLHSPWKPSL